MVWPIRTIQQFFPKPTSWELEPNLDWVPDFSRAWHSRKFFAPPPLTGRFSRAWHSLQGSSIISDWLRKLHERDMKCGCITCDLLTSMSSLFSSSGASMIFLSKKFSDSTSNLCPVTVAIRSQWRSFIALLAINSRRGQHSLKSSIFFFSSLNACHSLRALGSLRHLMYYTKAL